MSGVKGQINKITTMKKLIAGLLILGVVIAVAVISPDPAKNDVQEETQEEVQLGGITRTISYSKTTVATSSATQVLAVNTRAKYRRVQQDTNATVYCFAASTSTVTNPGGIRLTQGQSYEWSADKNNLWPGAISCISNSATSTLLTEEHYE
jgi:hypothetical protein